MAKPDDLPENFRERCPMCGSSHLQWGHVRARGLSFVTADTPIIKKSVTKAARRMIAAECQNCNYLIVLNRMS